MLNKTLTFLDNNITGHLFIEGIRGNGVDNNSFSPELRTTHRIESLMILEGRLEYVEVPDEYWKKTAKEMISKLASATPDAAVKIASSYLKGS